MLYNTKFSHVTKIPAHILWLTLYLGPFFDMLRGKGLVQSMCKMDALQLIKSQKVYESI